MATSELGRAGRSDSRVALACFVVVTACLGVLPVQAEGTGDTLDKDLLGVVSSAPGVPTNSAFAGFENNEAVSLYNGNLTVHHSSSPSFALDGGGSISLTRVYNSKNVRKDEVHTYDDTEWGNGYQYFPHGRSWVGRGWTMHLGRIFRRPVHNQLSGGPSGYDGEDWYFQDASGTEHNLRGADDPLGIDPGRIAAHPILKHEWHEAVYQTPLTCTPIELGYCGDACCEEFPPQCLPGWEIGVDCSCDCTPDEPVLVTPAYHEITFPNGTVYHFEFSVAEEAVEVVVLNETYKKGWIRNIDRAGWYVTWIRDVHGNQIDIEYFGAALNPDFPEAISEIKAMRAPETEPTTLIWTEVWDDGTADSVDDTNDPEWEPLAEGAVRFVHGVGANGTVSSEFLFDGESLTDPMGARDFPILREVKLPAADGQGSSVGSIRYVTGPESDPPSSADALMQRIEYPAGGASEYVWASYIAGRREGARCARELVGLGPGWQQPECEERIGRRNEIGVAERRRYPDGVGTGMPYSTWTWEREFNATNTGCAITANKFEMTAPDGTITRSTFMGNPCGGDYATGMEGWELDRRTIGADGVEIRHEAYEYDNTGIEWIHGTKTALEVMMKKRTVTFVDDTGACFDGAGSGAAKTMTTVSYARDAHNHWQLTRKYGSYLPASRLSYSRYLTTGNQVDKFILGLVDFSFTQEGDQRIEGGTEYSDNGLPTTTVRKAGLLSYPVGEEDCVPPAEDDDDSVWETWANGLSSSCGPTAAAAEDLVVCRTYLSNGMLDTKKYSTWGESSTCATSQYGASYDSTYAAITSARLDGLSYDSADVDVDAAGFVRTATGPNGLTSSFQYDDLGRLTRIDPPGSTEWPTRVVYPDLATTRVIRSPGEEQSFDASDDSQVFAEDRTDGLGRTIESWKALPDGTRAVRATRYDEIGRVVFVSEWIPEAQWPGTTIPWEGFDRDGDGQADYRIDVPAHTSGQPWGAVRFYGVPDGTEPGNPLKATADPLGRVRRVEDADGSFTTTDYCGPHSETTVTGIVTSLDSPSQTESAVYRNYNNGLGRLVIVDGPADGADAEYRYDLGGRIVRVNLVDQVPADPFDSWLTGGIADGQVRTFSFDAVGRLLTQTTPESGTSQVAKYDVWGNALETQDALGAERGYFFRNTFDVAGRMVRSEKVLGAPGSPSTSDELRLGDAGDFNEAADIGSSAWELGRIASDAFVSDASAWNRMTYVIPGCIPAPPGEVSGGAGLVIGGGCDYSSVPMEAQAARIALDDVTPDDVVSFKYWRQVRQGGGARDALEVYFVLQAEGDSVVSKRVAFRQDESQASYAQWRQTPALRLADLLAESDWPSGTGPQDLYLYVVFEKGDTETAGLGAGVMVDDVFVGRRAVETLAEWTYDLDACPDAAEACTGGEDGTNRYLGKLTREVSYDSGRMVAQRDFVYRGMNGRSSGERFLVDWAGVGNLSSFVSAQTYSPSGAIEQVHYPYMPGFDETRIYEYANRRESFDGVAEIRDGDPVDLVQPGGVAVDYNAAGGISRLQYANGTTTFVESDAQYRTHRIHVEGPAEGGGQQDLWDSGDYQYDNRGNISAIGDQRYAYDLVGRLTAARIVSQANPDTLGDVFRETYSYDLVGNMTAKTWEQEGAFGATPPTGANLSRAFPSSLTTNDNRSTSTDYRFDANGNTLRLKGASDGTNAAVWDTSNRMRAYFNGAPENGGLPAEAHVYDASGMRIVRYPDSLDGQPVLSVRAASGQLAAEYIVDPAAGHPKAKKDFVYGAGELMVEREAKETVAAFALSSPVSTNSTLNMTLTAGDGSSSYAVDIRTESGYTNLVTGIVPDAQGNFTIPESALLAGESNYLRIRGEGPEATAYSSANAVVYDPAVDSSSANQVKYMSVSRAGTQVTLRWNVLQQNGKSFKLYFTRSDTGQPQLLNAVPVPSGATTITFADQSLASPCGLFSVSQSLPDGSQETLPSPGVGLPSPTGTSVFGLNQGVGCGEEPPPPPPGPSGIPWVDTFHHRDHLGSLRVTTDGGGWMISGHDFYPFGMEVHPTGESAKGPSNMRFTGHERDVATGLDYMKARYSGWFQGSFLIPDPANDVNIKNPQSWNRYAYVRNNPINLVDPNGLESERKVPSHQNPQEQEGTAGVCPDGEPGECDARGVKQDIKEENQKEADEATGAVGDGANTNSNAVVHVEGDTVVAVIRGGTEEDREKVSQGLTDVFSTTRGREMVDNLVESGKPAVIKLNSDGDNRTPQVPGREILLDPNKPEFVLTTKGPMLASLRRKLAHELGHAVFGARDRGPDMMDNSRENENPIMVQLGEPERIKYDWP